MKRGRKAAGYTVKDDGRGVHVQRIAYRVQSDSIIGRSPDVDRVRERAVNEILRRLGK